MPRDGEERKSSAPRKSARDDDDRMLDDRRDDGRRGDRSPTPVRREGRRSPRRSRTRSHTHPPAARGSSSQSDESKVLAAIHGLKASVDTSMAQLNQKFNDFSLESTNRFNHISSRVDGINDRLAMVEAEREAGTGPVFGQAPAAASAPFPIPGVVPAPIVAPPPTSWNRVPDPTIIKIEAKFADKSRAKVSLVEVNKLMDAMATDMGIPLDQFKFESKELSAFHVMRFV
jgi:hypothetical protein